MMASDKFSILYGRNSIPLATAAPYGVHSTMHTLSNFSEEFHALFAHVPVPLMLIKELGGNIIAVNPAALELFECDGVPAEIFSRSVEHPGQF